MNNNDPFYFKDEDFVHQFTETSTFDILIPANRLDYIKNNMDILTSEIANIKLLLEIQDNKLTISTTSKTRDPFIIIKGRDMLQLIVKGVDIQKAKRVLEDQIFSEIIPLNANNETVLNNRRLRLEGPKGSTLKAIMLLTKTEVFIQKKSVCVIGHYKGLKEVREIVEGCFKNLHPAYILKKLVVKRELEGDKEKANEDWERFLPSVKSKTKNKRGDGKKKESEKQKKKLERKEIKTTDNKKKPFETPDE